MVSLSNPFSKVVYNALCQWSPGLQILETFKKYRKLSGEVILN